jgi:catechol 2,3-dioxygenase-like lactoylglutathione lyase family enzyme
MGNIGRGIFHVHLVVKDLEQSLRFYSGLLGMQKIPFEDGGLVFLHTPGVNDLLALNPGNWSPDSPDTCGKEAARENGLARMHGGISHFGFMLPTREEYERLIADAPKFGGRLAIRCDHHGHSYLHDPDGYLVELQYGR